MVVMMQVTVAALVGRCRVLSRSAKAGGSSKALGGSGSVLVMLVRVP